MSSEEFSILCLLTILKSDLYVSAKYLNSKKDSKIVSYS